MEEFTEKELEAAGKAIASTLRKNEKVYETLSRKQLPRTAQLSMVSGAIKHHQVMAAILENRLQAKAPERIAREDLEETLQAIPVYLKRIESVKPKFNEGTPQFTLAVRRIAAYYIVMRLIQEELSVGR